MDRERFERQYAARSGIELDDLHRRGIRAYPCQCEADNCEGWQMISREQAEIQVHLGLMTAEDAAIGLEPEMDE